MHNSGNSLAYRPNVEELLQQSYDRGEYVSKFLGVNGNWPSLRCATPNNNQASWHGLQVSPLQL